MQAFLVQMTDSKASSSPTKDMDYTYHVPGYMVRSPARRDTALPRKHAFASVALQGKIPTHQVEYVARPYFAAHKFDYVAPVQRGLTTGTAARLACPGLSCSMLAGLSLLADHRYQSIYDRSTGLENTISRPQTGARASHRLVLKRNADLPCGVRCSAYARARQVGRRAQDVPVSGR